MNQALQGNYRGKMNPETLVKKALIVFYISPPANDTQSLGCK